MELDEHQKKRNWREKEMKKKTGKVREKMKNKKKTI